VASSNIPIQIRRTLEPLPDLILALDRRDRSGSSIVSAGHDEIQQPQEECHDDDFAKSTKASRYGRS
jgi:hypothetical protein